MSTFHLVQKINLMKMKDFYLQGDDTLCQKEIFNFS